MACHWSMKHATPYGHTYTSPNSSDIKRKTASQIKGFYVMTQHGKRHVRIEPHLRRMFLFSTCTSFSCRTEAVQYTMLQTHPEQLPNTSWRHFAPPGAYPHDSERCKTNTDVFAWIRPLLEILNRRFAHSPPPSQKHSAPLCALVCPLITPNNAKT